MNFETYLSESRDQLDISIQAAGKYLTTDKKIVDFLNTNVTIEQKTDGVKITVIKQSNNGNIDDYIIAYKGNILYNTEYDYQPKVKIKKESIGASQFKSVIEHFTNLGKNSIPVGTELFIEYLMRKPTLSSNYTKLHKMVLIASTHSTWSVKFGKLKTSPGVFDTSNRISYAKELKIDVPVLLFDGILGSPISFEHGIKHKVVKSLFDSVKNSFTWDVPKILLDDIRQLFLNIESHYGGKEEGVVMTTHDRILKFQQDYQIDQDARLIIKMKYRDTPENETKYWNNVKNTALEIANGITVKSRDLKDLMAEVSNELKRTKLSFQHVKKTPAMIKDDIQLNVKTLIIKKMRGNNNVLIIGKFRILTTGHAALIKRASILYDEVIIDIVTSPDTKNTKALREKMIATAFPNAHIIHSINGNLIRIMQKSPVNINAIYAGSDRVQSYKSQLKNSIGVSVKEMPRTASDISASKIIDNIYNETYFKQYTPKAIHGMYEEIKGAYDGI